MRLLQGGVKLFRNTRRAFPQGTGAVSTMKGWYATTVLLALVYLAVIWTLPVLPCQDLPQHLAYARIFIDHARPDLRFQEFYTLPERFEPYHTVYWLLAALARAVGSSSALRLVMSAYVLGTFGAFHALVRSVWGRSPEPSWNTCLAVPLLWNPAVCMGLFSFALCIPIWLGGCACLLRARTPPHRARHLVAVAVCCAALASIHLVAAACFALFAVIFAITGRTRMHVFSLMLTATVIAATTAAWSKLGGLGLAGHPIPSLADAVKRTDGLNFLDSIFHLVWSSPTVKTDYLLWTVLGPYRALNLLLLAAAFAAAIFVASKARSRRAPARTDARALPRDVRGASIGFAALTLLAPRGCYVPTELTFIDLRMMPLAFALLLALIGPTWLETTRARWALVLGSFVVALHFAFCAFGFGREAAGPLRLQAKIPPTAVMESLPFHGRSAYFGTRFRLTESLPMYFTVKQGGIATQFWARYTEHLPVDYAPGKRPPRAADSSPATFASSHLDSVDYLLIQQASAADDALAVQDAHRKARAILEDRATLVDCAGDWCLFATARVSSR